MSIVNIWLGVVHELSKYHCDLDTDWPSKVIWIKLSSAINLVPKNLCLSWSGLHWFVQLTSTTGYSTASESDTESLVCTCFSASIFSQVIHSKNRTCRFGLKKGTCGIKWKKNLRIRKFRTTQKITTLHRVDLFPPFWTPARAFSFSFERTLCVIHIYKSFPPVKIFLFSQCSSQNAFIAIYGFHRLTAVWGNNPKEILYNILTQNSFELNFKNQPDLFRQLTERANS